MCIYAKIMRISKSLKASNIADTYVDVETSSFSKIMYLNLKFY